MNQQYNILLKKRIHLNEGESFCFKCKGKGIVKHSQKTMSPATILLVCDKCLGSGKLDWIEIATGQKTRQSHD